MYNILSIEIGLSASTLASFYRHQKSPRTTSMDKIIEWLKRREIRNQLVFPIVITVAVAVALAVVSVEVVVGNKTDAGTLIYGLGSENSLPLRAFMTLCILPKGYMN